jgi:hypothetical protein
MVAIARISTAMKQDVTKQAGAVNASGVIHLVMEVILLLVLGSIAPMIHQELNYK